MSELSTKPALLTHIHTHTPLPGPLFLPSSFPSSTSPLSSRVICSVSCLPLLAFPLHLRLVNFYKTLIGQFFQRLPLLAFMKTPPLFGGHSFFLLGRPPPLTLRLFLGAPPSPKQRRRVLECLLVDDMFYNVHHAVLKAHAVFP